MCKYILMKHSLCGCTTSEVHSKCSKARRNYYQCLYQPPPLLPFDAAYHFEMNTDRASSDGESLTPDDVTPEGNARYDARLAQRKKEKEEKARQDMRYILYAAMQRRMTMDRCAFCKEDWAESESDRRRMAFGDVWSGV